MSEKQSTLSVEQVTARLRKSYAAFKRQRVLFRVFNSLIILLAGLCTLVIAEQSLYLSSSIKTAAWALLFAAAGGYLVFRSLTTRHTPFEDYYRTFGRKSNLPGLKDSLDLQNNPSGNRELVNAAILQNLRKVSAAELERALSEFNSRTDYAGKYRNSSLLALFLLAITLLTSFRMDQAAGRTLSFWEDYQKPNPYLFTVTPGHMTLEQGKEFSASVTFSGSNLPEEVALFYKTDIEKEFRENVMNGSDSAYASLPVELNNSIRYYIQMDEFRSEIYTVRVQLPPRINDLTALTRPPAYTGLDETLRSYPFSRISAYEGSEITLSAQVNKDLNAFILSTGTDTLSPEADSAGIFRSRLSVTGNDTLRFFMEDRNGLQNKVPYQIAVQALKDEYPAVQIMEPEENLERVNPKELQIRYISSDDFGISRARLVYSLKRAFVERPEEGTISLSKPALNEASAYTWDLSDLRLKPRDELTYYIEVFDNDGYNGAKAGRSQSLMLSFPSMTDYFDKVGEEEEEVQTDLEDISESFEQVQQQYDEFREKMKEQPDQAGFEQKRELDQARKMQEEVQKKVEDLNRKFEEIKNELNRDNMLSPETQKAYDELNKLMKEIDDPEYLEMMEEMRDNLEQMNPDQLRQMMQQTEFNEESYRQRLERTLELFKQLKLNSDLDKLARSFEHMAEKQKEARENPPAGSEEKSAQQKVTKEENERLKEQVKDLSENTGKNTEKQVEKYQEETLKELADIENKLEDQNSGEGSEQSSEEGTEQSESGDPKQNQQQSGKEDRKEGSQQQSGEQNQDNQQDQPSSPQQQTEQQYQKLAEQTRSLQQQMGKQKEQMNIAGLQYALYTMLNLSLEQEDLVSLASATENRSQAYVGYAREQKNIQSIFSAISDSLFSLSKQIPGFSNRINTRKQEVQQELTRALEQMAERNQNQSSVATSQALGGINEIAFMVANLLEQIQNSSGGGSGSGAPMSMQQMMEQLRQSGQSQQQLNQQLQNLINDMQGDRLNQDQMERLNQIARQQNAIRKQIQQLQQSGSMEQGDKLGSELERMIEDMENTINDLRGGVADPTMIQRQQNILSRMLQAENSLQERDKEEKREGNTAQGVQNPDAPPMTLEELEKQIRERLRDPNYTRYSSDYQRLIERYFELLKSKKGSDIQ